MAIDSDVLEAMVDYDAILPLPRYAGGHDEQMRALFKGAEVLAHWNEGDYQGTVATAYKLSDGRFAWVQDSYGSCSGCDAWDDANDARVRELCAEIARSARVFNTLDEMLRDMASVDATEGSWRVSGGKELHALLTTSERGNRG